MRKILDESVSVIAETGSAVVGHSCLLDMEPGVRAELVIIIHQDFQDRGLGSRMLPLLADIARACRYHKIWLTVDSKNIRAIHIYRRFGFDFLGPFDAEREMELDLTSFSG